jgi:hypothetical protein
MFKNRYLTVVGLLSIFAVSLVISSFRTSSSPANGNAASDISLRNPNWTWAVAPSAVTIVTSDYYARHPELSPANGNAASDISLQNPNWTWAVAPSAVTIVTSDYYVHHPELGSK